MIGQRLLHYEIVEKLGEGGMGVVYKARDTHLDRFVAIKRLPPEKVADQERKARFVQEAKAASALNHPNIITIHDISSDAGHDFIAMEYIAGKTLDQLIGRKGLKLNDVLRYAIQIAGALAKAHAAGIVHRDLKPSNIMVTADGLVKVLDFGLAKLTERGTSESDSTVTLAVMTEEGGIVGTAAYMSPEQAEGRKVDARSDIFSFGSVLYEMVTGQRAFQGDSKMSALAAILQKEPKPLGAEIPHELEKIIARCLRKDPGRRYHDMDDVRIALEDLKEESDSGRLSTSLTPVRRRARRWVAVTVTAFAVALVIAAGWLLWQQFGGDSPSPRLVQLTSYPGDEWYPTFSPDGNQVAFTWGGERGDNRDIYVKLVGEANALRLTTDPASDTMPAWSRDGKRIAFLRSAPERATAIYLVSPLGGAEQKIADFPAIGQMSWSADGKWLAVGSRSAGICLAPAEGGEPRPLSNPKAPGYDIHPAFSPDGRRLAYAACNTIEGYSCDVYVQDLDRHYAPRGEPRRVTNQELSIRGLAWDRDGDSIVYSGSLVSAILLYLWRADIGTKYRAERLEVAGTGASYPSVSLAGDRLAFSRNLRNSDIWRYRSDGVQEPLITSSLNDTSPHLSPDGKRIAFESLRSGEASEIWVSHSDGSNQVQLTTRLGRHQGTPRWSPDGRWIAFDSQGKDGHWDIWVVEASGGLPRRITVEPSDENMPSWSGDGSWVYFRSDRTGRQEIWRATIADGRAEQVTQNGGFTAFESADGKTLFYTKAESSPLFAKVLGAGPERQVVDFVVFRAFAVVEDGIYYIGRGGENGQYPLRFLQFSTGKSHELTRLDHPTNYGLTVAPDRKTFVFTKTASFGSDLMLVENFR